MEVKTSPGDVKILTFTSLYPNASHPNHGVFVENRLRQLVAHGGVRAKVVAPVPWFPLRSRSFGRYALLAEVPRREERFGIDIVHPRYPVIPKIGMMLAPFLMSLGAGSTAARVLRDGYDFDLIDAHYFYPDGVAAVLLARRLGKPVTITARGTDINVISRHALAGRMIRRAADRASGLIAVSQALKDRMVDLGIDAGRIHVLRNGVDLEAFRPTNRTALRQRFELRPPVLASVGNLLPFKGHDLVIRALPEMPGARLLVVGKGPDESRLRGLVRELSLGDRVHFLGSVPHDAMFEIYNLADVLILASEREGWPNVLLEAMACGTPVVATNGHGIPEVIRTPAAGALLPQRTPEAIARTVRALLADPPGRAETRAYAEEFSWEATTRGQVELFGDILRKDPTRAKAAGPAPAASPR